jgi:glycosyltransferase involved in cell wall biosynthesis
VTARLNGRSGRRLRDQRMADAHSGSKEERISLLTGGADRPYAFGLTTALASRGVHLEVIAGDELDVNELRTRPEITLLNLRGDQRTDASRVEKVWRVLRYYGRLMRYAATTRATVFHILWNNKIEAFDRTLLMVYYRALGKRIALTVHNVNAGIRDGNDNALNRLTLRAQYHLSDHIFVHTPRMKKDIVSDFGVSGQRVTIIPFGINNAVPQTALSRNSAREHLALSPTDKAILFFGTIAPYKGLEYLVSAFSRLAKHDSRYRLIIAGRPRKGSEEYWRDIERTIRVSIDPSRVVQKIAFVSDEDTELYFKAADVAVLPYVHIFQSGVLFLAYSFGLPVIAADVGDLRDDIIEGETGFVVKTKDSAALAAALETYFASSLFATLESRRAKIRDYARSQHSWDVVADLSLETYRQLERGRAV